MILVIVVTYNAMRWIDRCLSSIVESERPKGQDIRGYVIDNGSTDGTQDYIREHFPEIVFVQNSSNEGFGKANNIGMRYAVEEGYDYVYLLNQDAWIESDAIAKLVDAQMVTPKYGILSPMQMQADGKHLDWQFSKRMKSARRADKSGIRSLPYIMAAHWLISRQCLLKVGLFSPVFPHYGEDENYCERVLYHGLKVGVLPKAKAVHDRAERSDSVQSKIRRNYYTFTIVRLSSLQKIMPYPRIYIVLMALAWSVRYLSMSPFNYMKKLLHAAGDIASMREKSRSEGAFIAL